ncbi:MAG: DCC1-like thiol-disulfide oxidoreductase family protein [Candidatus Sulfotelmatobacter sp.]
MTEPIILYDGVCGLCNRFVQFVLKRDPAARFRFAALQGEIAATILSRHNQSPTALDTLYLLAPSPDSPDGELLLARSDAVIFILRALGGIWPAVAFTLRLTPRPIRDWGYNLVARHRYRTFGRFDSCPLPTPETRARFLDP